MLSVMPSSEITEWQALFRIELEERKESEMKAKADASAKRESKKRHRPGSGGESG